jgi:hypothetical protein
MAAQDAQDTQDTQDTTTPTVDLTPANAELIAAHLIGYNGDCLIRERRERHGRITFTSAEGADTGKVDLVREDTVDGKPTKIKRKVERDYAVELVEPPIGLNVRLGDGARMESGGKSLVADHAVVEVEAITPDKRVTAWVGVVAHTGENVVKVGKVGILDEASSKAIVAQEWTDDIRPVDQVALKALVKAGTTPLQVADEVKDEPKVEADEPKSDIVADTVETANEVEKAEQAEPKAAAKKSGGKK